MIQELHVQHVGPAPQLDIEFAERLNMLTGDNGLGKTFLLDVAWWALTGTWAGEPAWPQRGTSVPEIRHRLWINGNHATRTVASHFEQRQQTWMRSDDPASLETAGLVVYAHVDDGFSVWDPIRNSQALTYDTPATETLRSKSYHFTPYTLWNGLREKRKVLCNGLISDWVTWQLSQRGQQTGLSQDDRFDILSRVVKKLSPHPGEIIAPGEPTRVSIEDVRDIPTIHLPYGNVPLIYASAGMKRIIGLAYVLTWAWYEHVQAASLTSTAPSHRLTLLVDEVESHLHPRWQRSIVPALLDVATALDPHIQTQIIVTTHSPLVLASVEPFFDDAQDQLFLFELQANNQVSVSALPWARQGDTVNWLVSDVFGLRQARSKEAEAAIEAAEALMRGEDMRSYPEHLRTREQIHAALTRLLPGHDPFWPRWIVTAQVGAS